MPQDDEDREKLVKSIWQIVQKANSIAPAHAQIHQNHIMFAEREKSFIRADKGTIKRRATVDLYEDNINQFYDSREDQYVEEMLAGVDLDHLDSIQLGVLKLISRILQMEHLKIQENIFAAGLDSLMVFRVLGALRGVLRNSGRNDEKQVAELRPYFVYASPTVEKLSIGFYKIAHGAEMQEDKSAHIDDDISKRAKLVEQSEKLLRKYTVDLPNPTVMTGPAGSDHQLSVILTGSTGSLGSYVLEGLTRNRQISRVTCLNRSTDGRSKQMTSNKIRGLSDDWPEGKVQFFQADMSKPNFGLGDDVYVDLLTSTTLVIRR